MSKNGMLEQNHRFYLLSATFPKGIQNTFLKDISVDKSQEKKVLLLSQKEPPVGWAGKRDLCLAGLRGLSFQCLLS